MTGSPHERIMLQVLDIVGRIPQGRVATHGAIGRYLGVAPRHVSQIMAGLDDSQRASVPWHRVVADGGAVGRHTHRDEQMARLKAEGLLVAPAGIVHGMTERAIADLDNPGAPIVVDATIDGPRRARGMKGRPTSTA